MPTNLSSPNFLLLLLSNVQALVFFGLLLPVAPSIAESGRLHVGFIGALSGPGRPYGLACQNGLEMGLDAAALKVTYEDDQFDPKKSVLAFKKLVDIDKVDVVVALGSSPAQAIAPLAQAAKIPLIAWASDEKVSLGKTFVIRSWPKGADEGREIAKEARKQNIKRPALVVGNSEYPQSVLRGMIAELGRSNVGAIEEVEPNLQDFKSILPKLKNGNVDAIGICLNPGQISLFARQVRDLGITLPIFGCITLDDPNEWNLANEKLSGSWYVTGNVNTEFRAAYRKRFGNEDLITGAAVYYDVAKLLGDMASKNVQKADLLAALLSSGKRNGAVGEFEVISESDDRFFSVPMVVKSVP